MKRLCFAVMAVAMAVAALAAPRTGPWTKEQAWEWYGKQPWIRGVNFVPSDCRGYVDVWQEWGFEKRFAHAERELALAHEADADALEPLGENGFGHERILVGVGAAMEHFVQVKGLLHGQI